MFQTSFKKIFNAGLLFALLAFISACSLYKSDGRKQFETNAKENLNLQDFKPIQCDDISPVSYWYETRITSPHSQWIESLPQLEVWLDTLSDHQIQIRTYEKHNDQPQQMMSITRCQSTFSSLEEWKEFRSFYLKSLEGEQP